MVIVTRTTKILGLSMLIGLLIGLVFYLILPKQYETRALLKSGVAWNPATNQADGFDTLENVVTQINMLKKQIIREEAGFIRPYRFVYLRGQPDPADSTHFHLFLRADGSSVAKDELTQILSDILEKDRKSFMIRQRQFQETVGKKRDELNQSKAQIGQLQSDIAELISTSASQATLKWFEKQAVEKKRDRLSGELTHLKMIAAMAKQTQLLVEPTLPLEPRTPNLHYLLSVGLAFGMIVGLVVTAFLGSRERVSN